MPRFTAWATREKDVKLILRIPHLLLVGLAIALSACSGGGPATTSIPNAQMASAASYTGPAPATADVQAFKVNLWQNIDTPDRCGNCHHAGGQTPQFARSDDVNLAYSAALTVVNLAQPDQSLMVIKVGGGHNCWLSSAQACADIITTWIKNWAGGATAGATQIKLTAPPIKSVGNTKTFPTNATDNGNASFANTIYPLLSQFCSRCHSDGAATPQTPYFASTDVNEAYANAQAKINLDTPTLSRFYVRLATESHNCWVPPGDSVVSCPKSAAAMLAAIQAFVGGIPVTKVDPTLVLSDALSLYDGTIASGQNRYDTGIIAKWEFKEGTGATADDTSGVDPALNLTLTGDYSWLGGWGVSFGPNGGAARGGASSSKLYNLIKTNGSFSIELWAAPANVTQTSAFMASYSGGSSERNFTLGQDQFQYEMFARSSNTDANGSPSLLTSATNMNAQASLSHIVMTYDPVNGRRLYVNGNFTGDVDTVKGGTIGNWDDSFIFLLGNETSGDRMWQGSIRFAAIYNQALTEEQVQQNFAAGVGQRYFLLFDVSKLTGLNQTYVMLDSSLYDSYSYLFDHPTFISLDPTVKPGNLAIKGMRIGINGAEAAVGQAYATLNTSVTDANYSPTAGQLLSSIGTVIGLEKGPDSDLFFLSFDQIGTHTHVRTAPAVVQAVPVDQPESPQLGVRVFNELNASMSGITGVSVNDPGVVATYQLVEQQLPSIPAFESFLASNQVGIAQLAIQYCDSLVGSTSAGTFFPGLNFSAPPASAFATTDALIDPLITRGIGVGIATQPADADVRGELDNLVTLLSSCGASCANSVRTQTITKAVCAAVLGSGTLLIK